MKLKSLLAILFLTAFTLSAAGVKWMETNRWNGNGIIETPAFELRGDEWKLAYTSKSQEVTQLELIDLETGNPLAVVRKAAIGANHTISMKDNTKGVLKRKVYFRISGSKAGWQASLNEYVGQIAAYELSRPKKEQKLNKYGIWCGDGGESLTIPITIPSKEWKITVKTDAPGTVSLKCTGAEEKVLADTLIFKPSQTSTWMYTDAGVTITLAAAENTPWTLTIETL